MASRDVKINLIGKDNASDDISRVNRSLRSLGKASLNVAGNFAAMGAGAAVAGGVWAIKLAADAEMLNTQIEVMLGSADRAKSMMADLTKFAADTPFEMPELADASKKLLAFGFAQEQVIPTMRRLGDVASALGIPLGELSEIYGKARVQGRLFAEDINQLTGRGIPVIQEFAKQFGVAESGVRGLVEKGKIGFAQLEQAIVSLTDKGSMFGGGMAKASQTLAGQFSTLSDEIKGVATALGTDLLPFMKQLVQEASTLAGLLGVKVGRRSPSEQRTDEQRMAEDRIRVINRMERSGVMMSNPLLSLFGKESLGEERTRLRNRLAAIRAADAKAVKEQVARDRQERAKEAAASQVKAFADFASRGIAGAGNAAGPLVTQLKNSVAEVSKDFAAMMKRRKARITPEEWRQMEAAEAAREGEKSKAMKDAKSRWMANKNRLLNDEGGSLGAMESRFLTRGTGTEPPMVREMKEANRIAKEELKEVREQNRHLRRMAEKRGLAAANF